MVKLVIPTRNRPASFSKVLEYVAEFYPGTEVVVADGSEPSYQDAYAQAIEENSGNLAVAYKLYGPGPSLGERMIDVLTSIKDDYIIVGADDDYPVLDVLTTAEYFLRENPDYVLAIGGIIGLRLFDDGNIQAKLLHARSIEDDSPIQRVNNYIQWPYATSYGLVKRECHIERYRNSDINCMPGFGDFNLAFHDCLTGKIKALDKICYFTTTNPTHSKLRLRSQIFYLEHAREVLEVKKHYYETLSQKFNISNERAENIANRLINARIVELISPALQNRPGFGYSELFRDPVVHGQYDAFQALFIEGTSVRDKLLQKLCTIVTSIKEVASAKSDNLEEPSIYDSLEAMQSGATQGG